MNESLAIPDVDAAEAARLTEDGAAVLLDVREDDEWSRGHAPQATHVALGSLDPAALPRDRPVIAVCRSGNRAGKAAQALAAAGIDVCNLNGGMTAWAAAGLAVVQADGTPGQIT